MQKLSNSICINYVSVKQPFQVVSHVRAVYLNHKDRNSGDHIIVRSAAH